MRTAVVIAVALVVAGCATRGLPDDRPAQLAAEQDACTSRGGMLTPSMDRRLTGKPGGGYVCRINGSGSRIPPPTTAG